MSCSQSIFSYAPTNNAILQIHSSRAQQCLDPCTQSMRSTSSGAKVQTDVPARETGFSRSHKRSKLGENEKYLGVTPQCSSTTTLPSSRRNSYSYWDRRYAGSWA